MSIMDYMTDAEAHRFSCLSTYAPMTKEERSRLHFIRSGGRDCQLKKQRKAREEKAK